MKRCRRWMRHGVRCTAAGLLAGALLGMAVPPGFAGAEDTGGPGPDGMAGDGTAMHPFVISNVQDLADLAAMEGNGGGTAGKYFILEQDIDGTGTNWVPIPSFSGILDGRGHTITGLHIVLPAAPQENIPSEGPVGGLIGVLQSSGEIHNLGLKDVQMDLSGAVAGGALVGIARQGSAIVHCYSSGSVRSSQGPSVLTGFPESFGGLVGANGGTIRASYSNAHVSMTRTQIMVASDPIDVGGLVGYNQISGVVDQSFANASQVSAAAPGTVTAYVAVGGLAGQNNGSVSDVYTDSGVLAETGGYSVGGVIGVNQGMLEQAFAVGRVVGSSTGPVGGLVGTNWAPADKVWSGVWDTEGTGQPKGIGEGNGAVIGKTHDQMRGADVSDLDAYKAGWAPGWDFENVWIPGLETPDHLPQLRSVVGGFTLDITPEIYMVPLRQAPWYTLYIPLQSAHIDFALMTRPLFPGATPLVPGPWNVLVIWNGVSMRWQVPFKTEPLIGATFTMPGENPMVVPEGEAYVEPGWTATSPDGNTIPWERPSRPPDKTSPPGEYPLRYTFLDQDGHPAKTFTRTVLVRGIRGLMLNAPGLMEVGQRSSLRVFASMTDGAAPFLQEVTSGATLRVAQGNGTMAITTDGTLTALAPGTAQIEAAYTWGPVTTTATAQVTVADMPLPPSSDADLGTLVLSGGSLLPSFDARTTNYTVNVGQEIRSVDISAGAAHPRATLVINGSVVSEGTPVSVNLAVGDNLVTIVVIAEDGTTKVYTVTITRAASPPPPPPSGGGGASPSAPALQGILVTPDSVRLKMGEEKSLETTAVYDGNARQDVTRLATYASSDPGVAQVDIRGVVTGTSPGTATVTVTYQGASATVRVEVGTDASPLPPVLPNPPGLPTSPGVPAPPVDFADTRGHWAAEWIRKAAEQGWVSGYGDGTFHPDSPVTREEFAALLTKALELRAGSRVEAQTFADQAAVSLWATDAVETCVRLGILHGYEDGMLRPQGEMTRAEMAVMIAKALALNPREGYPAAGTGFADDGSIPEWAKGAVEALVQAGLVHGRGGNRFDPQGVTTRAEAVTLLLAARDLVV